MSKEWRRAAWAAAWLAAGLVVWTAGCGPQSGAPTGPADGQFRPFFFIHAGDPQIGGWASIEDTAGRFAQLAGIANRLKPAFVMVVGDLVNDGPHARQLEAFDNALKRFRVPVRLISGNHDDLATFRARYGPDRYAFTHNDCEFICINSDVLARIRRPAWVRKESGEQWRWLERALPEARKRRPRHIFLVMHHPPLLLPQQLRLEKLMAAYGVRVVLAGHIHRTMEYVREGYAVYTVAGTGWAHDARGYGYRIFKVYADRIEQEYIRLDQPLEKVRLAPAELATQPAR